jgi:hypothetical protein
MAGEWYYTTNRQRMGPVSWDELRQLATKELLKPDDLIWTEGMTEWVKAVRQQGLFAQGAPTAAAISAAAADYPPAPPKPSARQRMDDELDEGERRRRPRPKRTSAGLKIGLIVGAVAFVMLVLSCGLVAVLALTFDFGGFGGGGGTSYNLSLAPNAQDDRVFSFRAGQRVTVTVRTSRIAGPFQPDVDLFVLRGGQQVAADTRISPDCNVTFVAPVTAEYIVRVKNLGPGMASSRVVVR